MHFVQMLDSKAKSGIGAAWSAKFEHTVPDRPARYRLNAAAH
jgi:hypothetical protein